MNWRKQFIQSPDGLLHIDDLNFQNFSTVQNGLQPKPVSMAATTTIAPTTFVTILTGTVQIKTITPPFAGSHILVLLFTDASPGVTLTTGNIILATTVVQNKPVIMTFEPASAKYYPSY